MRLVSVEPEVVVHDLSRAAENDKVSSSGGSAAAALVTIVVAVGLVPGPFVLVVVALRSRAVLVAIKRAPR